MKHFRVRVGIALSFLVCIIQFQNCSQSPQGSQESKDQQAANLRQNADLYPGSQDGGNGYDGKIYVVVNRNQICADGTYVRAAISKKIENDLNNFYLLRSDCNNIVPLRLDASLVREPNPDELVVNDVEYVVEPDVVPMTLPPVPYSIVSCRRDASILGGGFTGNSLDITVMRSNDGTIQANVTWIDAANVQYGAAGIAVSSYTAVVNGLMMNVYEITPQAAASTLDRFLLMMRVGTGTVDQNSFAGSLRMFNYSKLDFSRQGFQFTGLSCSGI